MFEAFQHFSQTLSYNRDRFLSPEQNLWSHGHILISNNGIDFHTEPLSRSIIISRTVAARQMWFTSHSRVSTPPDPSLMKHVISGGHMCYVRTTRVCLHTTEELRWEAEVKVTQRTSRHFCSFSDVSSERMFVIGWYWDRLHLMNESENRRVVMMEWITILVTQWDVFHYNLTIIPVSVTHSFESSTAQKLSKHELIITSRFHCAVLSPVCSVR